jgi:hypothetical protein
LCRFQKNFSMRTAQRLITKDFAARAPQRQRESGNTFPQFLSWNNSVEIGRAPAPGAISRALAADLWREIVEPFWY